MKPAKLSCFLALPYSPKFERIKQAIQSGANQAGFQVVSLDEQPVLLGRSVQDTILNELARVDCIIADVTDRNPNVFFEIGIAQAMGKGILLIAEDRAYKEVPFDIREFRIITYLNNIESISTLKDRVKFSLLEFRRFPKQKTSQLNLPFSPPFFVEWDRLTKTDIENLCQELLIQLGFRRLDWFKSTPEVDLIAELPKKDPDGFEYRELWLVSFGLRTPIDMLIDLAMSDPEYLLQRLIKYSSHLEQRLRSEYDSSITILLVLLRKESNYEDIEILKNKFERRRLKMSPFNLNIRLRTWDREYLTSLVQRFPQIGYKYFSDEGRIRSKTRKSYEELYLEYSQLSNRQNKLIIDLQEEKNKRIRAERDSIWKDISFAAAHKIGNPIFAIETDLNPLVKRIREKRTEEAVDVVKNIRSAVEKAKAFVEQFKSLSKAQEIKLSPIPLYPILEDSCRLVHNNDVVCTINCPREAVINGDADRLAECFDELVMNSTHWFDKPQKTIEISVIDPAPEPLPDFLETSQRYVLIHIKDNGCGIHPSDKRRIFDAFYTKYEHGTGLGLALVRRIIDGHGGGVVETGALGKGADFEIYLTTSSE